MNATQESLPLTAPPTVFLVDDDESLLAGLTQLVMGAGYHVASFGSAEALLAAFDLRARGCVVLDVGLPGLQGWEAQTELSLLGSHLPILFLTGKADVPMTVEAIRSGARDVLVKPASPEVLLARIAEMVSADVAFIARQEECQQLRNRLTEREREVLRLVAEGLVNKDIGTRLGISYRTVEVHRAHIVQKTGLAGTLPIIEFVRRARAAGLSI